MTIYAIFDGDGFLAGCYPDDVFPPLRVYGPAPEPTDDDPEPVSPIVSETRNAAIPAEAVEITAEQWLDLIAHPRLRKWVDGSVTAYDPPPPPPLVPDSASRLGLMRALREVGKWDAVKAAIAADAEVQEEWDLAVTIKRTDPLTEKLVAQLGLAPADVDHLLIRAAALVA